MNSLMNAPVLEEIIEATAQKSNLHVYPIPQI